jgi:3D (Asp-Asp-Asp) domain-containing protein
MKASFLFLSAIVVPILLSSCAQNRVASGNQTAFSKSTKKIEKVRTTAYTHTERDHIIYGRMSAAGTRLSSGHIRSAAADWSRFPVGTKFRVRETGQVYQVDDYGSALAGTSTIDLYTPTRREMNRWGVQFVDIDIIAWGSPQVSLNILKPRAKNSHVQTMIRGIEQKM